MTRSAALAAGLITLVFLVRWPALGIPANDPENILGLSVGARGAGAILWRFYDYLPYYRPVGNLSLWVQYAPQGLSAIPLYFAVNLALCGLCAYLFAVLLAQAGAGFVPSALAAAYLATHPNTFTFATIIGERMNALYLILGFLALLAMGAVWRNSGARPGVLAISWLLLFLSALSKELGLAFSFVVFATSLWLWQRERRGELLVAAGGACAVVALVVTLHLSILGVRPGIGFEGDCHPFLTQCWRGSYLDLGVARSAASLAYVALANMGAAFLPFAFDSQGVLTPPPYSLKTVALALAFSALAWWGALRAPPLVRVAALALIVGHGIASMMLFRYRNHLASDAGALALAAFGAIALCGERRIVGRLALVLVAGFIAYRALSLHRATQEFVDWVWTLEPDMARSTLVLGASPQVIEIQRERFLINRAAR